MNWSEFTSHHAARFGLTKRSAKAELDGAFETIREVVLNGGHVSVPGFGVFKLRSRRARTIRNPSSGELMRVGLVEAVGFSASRFARRAAP